ncbi:Pr6Pr family membrane protein [Leucobacter ruminantium]|uniref:Pr6Pr family membrane protein n=1 Tax=Leucobacter ruminantium TaxID=1289170 RepID=A0A939LT62_9MICO|nr:Pr6Pr family membrane protein [Leucobacter ruminantium]MBO1804274.1 Pr6Pr family membrane protein [Leucobacter ruminantium]
MSQDPLTRRRTVREGLWPVLRLLCAILILVAIWQQAATTFSRAVANGSDVATTVANFFSFFTILSNIAALLVLAVAAVRVLRAEGQDGREPRSLSFALASASSYMILTGIVYNVLLRQIPLDQGATVPWSNEVLHVVAPAFMLADVVWAPGRARLPWRAVLGVLVFPLAWVIYTLVRGPLVTSPATGNPWWYPYPFLDPHLQDGYGGVFAYVIGIAVVIAVIAVGVVAVGRARDRTSAAAGD